MADQRPICDCNAYRFPHKVGGRCTGAAFAEWHFYNDRSCCEFCNCLRDDGRCDAVMGLESIKEAECYQERVHAHPGERLPILMR